MGKKQKIVQKHNGIKAIEKNEDRVIIEDGLQITNDKMKKLSKKQKRKMRKLQNDNKVQKQQENSELRTMRTNNVQTNELIQQERQENDESLIEIVSSSIDQDINNDVEFDPKGKQGFESLVNQTNFNIQNHVKSISIKSTLSTEGETTFYLFHLKKDTFYKATVPVHENINLTHLNQSVKLSIFDENLLKQGSHDPSCLFWENGKITSSQIEFLRSAVFKIVNNQEKSKQNLTTKDKKKSSQTNTQQMMKKNIQKFIKPSTETQINEIADFLHDFEWKEDSIVICKQNLILSETKAPFQKIDPKILSSNGSLMILGKKNTGKSTLAEYLKNISPTQICILDCDIGRSLTVSGCVSLITQTQSINLWVGEFTPFNCIQNYVNAIQKLYQLYRQKYFSKKLIINTMGYLSGLGQMIIYEIYSLVNPSEIIVLTSGNEQQQSNDSLASILYHIKAGTYLNKLLTVRQSENTQRGIRKFNEKKLSLNIQYLANIHAQGKGIPIRFQSLIQHKKSFKNILELIQSIKKKQMQKIENINLYQQDKLGNVQPLDRLEKNYSDMRIVLIGKWIELTERMELQNIELSNKLFRVFGIGFGFQGAVYYSQKQIQTIISPSIILKQEAQNIVGVLSEGIDFEKNFYLINQFALIEHELSYGTISYIMPIIKGMGSKGTRNNPSKNV